MLDRTVTCPACGRPTRLTEPELVTKRGFCAACDARFELLPEMFIGEGPHRELAMIPVTESAQPPTRRVRVLSADSGATFRAVLTGWNQRRLVRIGMAAGLVGGMGLGAAPSMLHLSSPLIAVGMVLTSLSLAIGLSGWSAFEREEITIDGDHLILRRREALGFYRTRKIPLAAIAGVSMATERIDQGGRAVEAPIIKVLQSGEDPLQIGSRFRLETEVMRWLCRRLEREVRSARVGASPAVLPAAATKAP